MSEIIIRTAEMSDLDAVSRIESACFPAAEAATKEEFEERLRFYANRFLLLFADGKLVSFADGFVTDEADLRDEMYENASLHNENGAWQMIFGVNTLPEYRGRGYARRLIRQMTENARAEGRKGVVLTCKKEKIRWYESLGFTNEGESRSVHGGVTWYQMRLRFD